MIVMFDAEFILEPIRHGHTLFVGPGAKRRVEYVVATAIEGLGLLEFPWATRLNYNPHHESYEVRRKLQELACNQTVRDRLYHKAAFASIRRPQATWDVEFSPYSNSLQLIFLG